MNREDPKERYAGQKPVTVDDSVEAVSIISPEVEEEIETTTREEMRKDEEERKRLAAIAAQTAAGIPVIPAAPEGSTPDPYTLLLLQGMQATQQALLQFLQKQNETEIVPFHKIKHDTPWNPTGKRERVKLRRPTFISGYPVNPMMHTEEEITLLNEVKPGRYNNRRWEVTRFDDGSIDIRYPNRTFEQRMEMALKAPSISELCKQIIAEREQQDARKRAGDSLYGDEDE